MNTKINKVATTSENIPNDNLEKLRSVFPSFVKDGEVDFDALQAFLKTEWVLSGEEKYGLSWAGKSNAFRAIRTPATGTLTPQPEESKNWDETKNIFIEWDNLEVLKLLQKHYRWEIKMIYIDPPYNTGKDFVYKDNFTKWVADYYEQTGQTKDGIKMTANTEKNGRYHSDWLTMMYPRLFLAHNLLREDGVIFISIDDNEVANLRMIMDDIFGEENFINHKAMIWHIPDWTNKWFIARAHEYIIGYAKNINSLAHFNRPWYLDTLSIKHLTNAPGAKNKVSQMLFKKWLRCESTEEFIIEWIIGGDKEPIKTVWKMCFKEGFLQNDIVLESSWKNKNQIEAYMRWEEVVDEKGQIISEVFFKRNGKPMYKKELSSYSPKSVQQFKTTSDESAVLDWFYFNNPKPVELISFLAGLCTKDCDLILDFFAGSWTTAHAIMELNVREQEEAEEERINTNGVGQRKFICVQLPEATEEDGEAYKAGYKKISDITRERIRRAGDKIGKGDIGFKSFVLASSNYRQWNTLTDSDDAEILKAQMKLFAEKPLEDDIDKKGVIYELLVKEGFWLNSLVKEVTVGVLKVWKVLDEGRSLAITFAPQVSQEQVELLKLTDADTFICFDSALDDTTKVNLVKNFNIKVI